MDKVFLYYSPKIIQYTSVEKFPEPIETYFVDFVYEFSKENGNVRNNHFHWLLGHDDKQKMFLISGWLDKRSGTFYSTGDIYGHDDPWKLDERLQEEKRQGEAVLRRVEYVYELLQRLELMTFATWQLGFYLREFKLSIELCMKMFKILEASPNLLEWTIQTYRKTKSSRCFSYISEISPRRRSTLMNTVKPVLLSKVNELKQSSESEEEFYMRLSDCIFREKIIADSESQGMILYCLLKEKLLEGGV